MDTLPSVQYTKDYSLFVYHPLNRLANGSDLRVTRKKLWDSLKTRGFRSLCPIVCQKRDNGKLMVIDGHNRLAISEQLNIGVYYLAYEIDEEIDLARENAEGRAKSWSIKNYVEAYAKSGNANYVELLLYSKETGIPAETSASLLRGEVGSTLNCRDALEKGEFRIKERLRADAVAATVKLLAEYVSWGASRNCAVSIAKCLVADGFVHQKLMDQIQKVPEQLEKQRDVDKYLEMWEKIYNFRTRAENHYPLVHKVESIMRARKNFKKN